jgi:beta-xylosidase
LIHWQEHPFRLKATDFTWASGKAYASKVVVKDNQYYWFVSVSHKYGQGAAIGVAVSTSPLGPFHDFIGSPLITHDMLPTVKDEKANLDPTVMIDDDGQAYIFWGNGICYFAKLKNNLTGIDSDITIIDLPNFEEGSHIHKRDGSYYLSYGCGMPEAVAYAMSRDIRGPWEYKGILNDLAYNCKTNRPCIVDLKNQSYFIYHNGALLGGGSHRRSVCVDYLYYNVDGSMKKIMMTREGIQPVR